jgi:CBS domain-containing protein
VYDYGGGKKDWLAAGLPLGGERSDETRAGDIARIGVPTCSIDTTLGELTKRSDFRSWGFCVVVDHEDVVHGEVVFSEKSQWDENETARDVMSLAPTTRRPSLSLEDAREDLEREVANHFFITTQDGQLRGVILAADLVDEG